MENRWQKKKVFIVVKTYPNLSTKYGEVVCTAGITEDGQWIRLYPVPFRYQAREKQFSKYEWVEVNVQRHTEDPRTESFRPDLDTLEIISQVDTKDGWLERKRLLLPLLSPSKEALAESIHDKDQPGHSLGIIKPKEIKAFVVESATREFTEKQKAILQQQDLFGDNLKDLDKIPYKFSYRFSCADERCTGHTLMIEDWEIAQLYRNCLNRCGGDETKAIEQVKEKYEGFMRRNDLHFVLGTTKNDHFRGTYVIICVFYPPLPKESDNMALF